MIRAGLLDELITVERYQKQVDQYGGDSGQWETVAEDVPCSVNYRDSGFGESAGALVYAQMVTFQLRYTDVVREYDRVLWDGRKYHIDGIDRSKRRYGEMSIICSMSDADEGD